MKDQNPEVVRDALKVRLKNNPLIVQTEMPRAGYRVEGMNVERRIHADQHRKLLATAPMMCRNCAHMKDEEHDKIVEGNGQVKIINTLCCSKPTVFTCPDGFRTEIGKWATHKISANFVSGDDEPMLTMDMTNAIETSWPPTDIARAAGFMEYVSPDELKEINDKHRAYKERRKTESSTPKTVDGDVW